MNQPIDDVKFIDLKDNHYLNKDEMMEQADKMYAEKLFSVAKNIHSFLVDKKLNVLVYCGTGISRSPTAAMAYLCLFKNVICWENLQLVEEHIKVYLPSCKPNLRVVQHCIR